MSDAKSLLALADGDDAVALLVQLGDTPTYRVRSESGETLFLTRSTAARRSAWTHYSDAAV